MSEAIKISEEEINQIKELQGKFSDRIYQFGNLYLEKMQIDAAIKKIQEKEDECHTDWKNLQKMENDIIDKILKKYGEGSLDLKAGLFIPEKK